MKDQINSIRRAVEMATPHYQADTERFKQALTALSELEAMAGSQEPVAKLHDDGYWTPMKTEAGRSLNDRLMRAGSPSIDVYAAPVAQQYEAGDMASAFAQGFRDGVASVTQQEPVAWAMPKGDGTFIDVITPAEHARDEGSYTVPLFAHPVAQQPQARPDFTDEWTGYLKDGETPFERFLRERKDLNALTKLYQRVLEENERLKAQQPQAEPHKPLFADLIAQHPGLREELLEMDKQPQVECAMCGGMGYIDGIGNRCGLCDGTGRQPQAEAVPAIYVSRGQLENLKPDPEDAAGTYLPVRKTPKGKFTYPLFSAPQQAEAVPPSNLIDPGSVVSFAVDRWLAEVSNRPLVNKNRRTLDDTWRQVIRRFGGDPDVLLGPPHDELAAIAQQKGGV